MLLPAASLTALKHRFTNHYARPKTSLFTQHFTGILSLSPIIGLQRYCFFFL